MQMYLQLTYNSLHLRTRNDLNMKFVSTIHHRFRLEIDFYLLEQLRNVLS